MDKELLYNASGAKDETAYKAIINVMKGSKDMGVMGVKEGEVWEVESGVSNKRVVVLRCFEDYAATIMLQDYEPKENSVKVIAHGIMYADTGRLGYVFYDKFVSYGRTLTEEEVKDLQEGVVKALSLGDVTSKPQIEEIEESLLMPFPGYLEDGITEAMAAAREDLAAARKEAEIYKGLYEAMLQRALK